MKKCLSFGEVSEYVASVENRKPEHIAHIRGCAECHSRVLVARKLLGDGKSFTEKDLGEAHKHLDAGTLMALYGKEKFA